MLIIHFDINVSNTRIT